MSRRLNRAVAIACIAIEFRWIRDSGISSLRETILQVDSKKVGILGGGQLALMLAQNAPESVHWTCAVDRLDEPVARCFPERVKHIITRSDFEAFIKPLDILVFENEFLKDFQLESLERFSNLRAFPSLACMQTVADKWQQKQILQAHGIPTSPFVILDRGLSIERALSNIHELFPTGFVLKWSKLGYDGHGVLVCRPKEISLPKVESFIKRSGDCAIYAEEWIPFEQEVAIIAATNDSGITFLPATLTVQSQGRCSEVYAPAAAFGYATIDEMARETASRIAEAFQLEGVFAVEFFFESSRGLLVNEIAPRVHNSGHYSLDATSINQFRLHWLSLLGEDLSALRIPAKPSIMVNLLGPGQGPIEPPQLDDGVLHWYHKSISQPGRKLGHVNLLGSDVHELKLRLRSVQQQLQHWRPQ